MPLNCVLRTQFSGWSENVKKSAAAALIELLAAEGRRVLSVWRGTVLWRRATLTMAPSERRWTTIPADFAAIQPLLRQMQRRGEIQPLSDVPQLYEVTSPYARGRPIEEVEILMEANPYAALSHLSALVFHSLTDQLPKEISAVAPTGRSQAVLPLGTTGEDWEGLPLVSGRRVKSVLQHPVRWHTLSQNDYSGTREYRPHEYPMRVTTLERTLVDGLQQPGDTGGIGTVLTAWASARDLLDLEALVDQVDRLDIGLLRQRVGFVLDQLGLSHSRVEQWRAQTQRGGSSKLVATAPYAPTYDERWNLSINASITALQG